MLALRLNHEAKSDKSHKGNTIRQKRDDVEMKSYVFEIEETNKTDNEILMTIIKALATSGIKTKSVGVQQMKPINIREKTDNE